MKSRTAQFFILLAGLTLLAAGEAHATIIVQGTVSEQGSDCPFCTESQNVNQYGCLFVITPAVGDPVNVHVAATFAAGPESLSCHSELIESCLVLAGYAVEPTSTASGAIFESYTFEATAWDFCAAVCSTP